MHKAYARLALMQITVVDRGEGLVRESCGYVWCEGEGVNVVLAFSYNAAQIGEAKAIGGRRFDCVTRTNIFRSTGCRRYPASCTTPQPNSCKSSTAYSEPR